MERACTKQSKTNPLGICSYTDGSVATIVCPARFRENGHVFIDAARAAFGSGMRVLAVPEVRLLDIPATNKKTGKLKKIGKIDYIIALLNNDNEPVDFAAVEVQAVYISGGSTRAPFEHYLRTGGNQNDARRRPDFRSSAQKRLMPQLSIKVPVFRRWGKRFFVVVDASFFNALPPLKTVSEGTAEITWLVYPFERSSTGFTMGNPKAIHTVWDDVVTSLREGNPPTREELLAGLMRSKKKVVFST